MLTKEQRDILIEDIREQDYSYSDYGLDDPDIKVSRELERFKAEPVQIILRFYPASNRLYQSVSDVIGKAKGEHFQYGYCQTELCEISVYSNEFVSEYNIPGRDFSYFLIEKIRNHTLSHWDSILKHFGAARAINYDVTIDDNTMYIQRLGKKIYNYFLDFYIKTQFNWNKVPQDYDENDDLVESITYNMQDEDEFKIIIK